MQYTPDYLNTFLLKEIIKKIGTQGDLPISNGNPVPVNIVAGGSGGSSSGGLTNTELRATPVPISGTITVSNPGSGGLTDAELRASAISVTPTVIGLTDTQLRATAVPVSVTSIPLAAGAATNTVVSAQAGTIVNEIINLEAITATEATLTALNSKVTAVNTGAVVVSSSALPSGAATSALQTTGNSSLSSIDGKFSSLGQKAMSASSPVVISSDQSNINVVPKASTVGTGGGTAYKLLSAATTNAQSVKGSAGQLYTILAVSTVATIKYLKLYNKASAPTVGTDTPIMTIPIPGNTAGAGVSISFPVGVNFSTGIAIAITGAVADADTTVIAANDIILTLVYA